MEQTKRYIAPGGWFALAYPAAWSEFEDEEGSFLFYNPEQWTGNFRISAYKDRSDAYARESIAYELEQNEQAVPKTVGSWPCAYSCETFMEDNKAYTTHFWVTGRGNTAVECSFTVTKGGSVAEAEAILASLEIRDGHKRHPREVIPVRVLEISEINAAYDWATLEIKKTLKKDFTATAQDVPRIQEYIQKAAPKPHQREAWQALGITLGTIFVNEMDGMEWCTVVDGTREFPALRFAGTGLLVCPQDLLLDKVARGQECNLPQIYDEVKQAVENVL